MENTSGILSIFNRGGGLGGSNNSGVVSTFNSGGLGGSNNTGLIRALQSQGCSGSDYLKDNTSDLLLELKIANKGLTDNTILNAQMVSIKKLTRLTLDTSGGNVSEAVVALIYPIDQKMIKIDSVCHASLPNEYKNMILDIVSNKYPTYSPVVDTESGIRAYFNKAIRPMFDKIPELLTDLLELLQQVSAIKSEGDLTMLINSMYIAIMQYVQLIGIILDQRIFSPALTEILLSHNRLYVYL